MQLSSRSAVVWGRARTLARFHWPLIALAALAGFAVFIRLYRLGAVPNNLTADERDFFLDVYHMLAGPRQDWFFQGQAASLAPLGVFAQAWSVLLFGDSIFGLRMYTVILSLATLVPYYVLARHRFSPFVATISTLLLSSNIWFLHFSRTAWTNMNSALIAIGVVTCLTLGLERGRWWWFAAAGFFIGISPWAYVSARIVPFVAALSFPLVLLAYRDHWRRAVWGFALAGAVSAIIAAPVLYKLPNGLWDN